jgi:hypothetical protein
MPSRVLAIRTRCKGGQKPRGTAHFHSNSRGLLNGGVSTDGASNELNKNCGAAAANLCRAWVIAGEESNRLQHVCVQMRNAGQTILHATPLEVYVRAFIDDLKQGGGIVLRHSVGAVKCHRHTKARDSLPQGMIRQYWEWHGRHRPFRSLRRHSSAREEIVSQTVHVGAGFLYRDRGFST